MKHASTTAQTIALHRIQIASPCTASWERMKGDNHARHCNDCDKRVFNLSAMAEADAAALLAQNHSGDLCVRFYRRADGTVMTSDCGASPQAAASQAWRAMPAMATAAVLALSVAACGASETRPVTHASTPVARELPPTIMMGAPPAMPPEAGNSDAQEMPSRQAIEPSGTAVQAVKRVPLPVAGKPVFSPASREESESPKQRGGSGAKTTSR